MPYFDRPAHMPSIGRGVAVGRGGAPAAGAERLPGGVEQSQQCGAPSSGPRLFSDEEVQFIMDAVADEARHSLGE